MTTHIKTLSIRSRARSWRLLLGTFLLFLSGCKGTAKADISPDQALTDVAQTVNAAISQTQSVPTDTPTATSTFTLTILPSPTSTLEPTITIQSEPANNAQVYVAPAPQTTSCDSATFNADITVPDGSSYDPGESFTKTWRLENTGTCSWTSSYAVIFTSGDQMSADSPITLDVDSISPGETVDISIDMVSPITAGQYSGYWQLANASGTRFGDLFYVQIEVMDSITATPTATFTPTGDTPTPTDTVATSTATSTLTPSDTPVPTNTSTPTDIPTNTPVPTDTLTDTPVPTDTPIP